jgi:hypothetical protein
MKKSINKNKIKIIEDLDSYLKNNRTLSKGELMIIAYNDNIRNVDSAIPLELWEKLKPYGGTFYFVMDYNENRLGELIHLGEKILGIKSNWNEKLNN